MIDKKNEEILQEFGAHLRKLRLARKLSLRQLSYACNIDNSKISRIELGKINITVLTILELAMGLNVKPAELLDFINKK